jgi:hypothetical protein
MNGGTQDDPPPQDAADDLAPPSREDWAQLIEELRTAERVRASAFHNPDVPDDLHADHAAATHALVSVLKLLRKSPAVARGGLDGPLVQLCAAMADTNTGRLHPLFQPHRRTDVKTTKGGTAIHKSILMAFAAGALDALMKAGAARADAAAKVAGTIQAARIPVTTRRDASLSATVLGWREALMTGQGEAPNVALQGWERYQRNPEHFGATPRQRADWFLNQIRTNPDLGLLE